MGIDNKPFTAEQLQEQINFFGIDCTVKKHLEKNIYFLVVTLWKTRNQ